MMDSLTKRKVSELTKDGEFQETGVVLTNIKGARHAIVDMAAVRWLTDEEKWKLMHPTDIRTAVEFDGHTFMLEPCPWCAKGEFSIRAMGRVWSGTKYGEPSSYEVIHHCEPTEGQPSRAIIRVGRDLQSAISAWNKRK